MRRSFLPFLYTLSLHPYIKYKNKHLMCVHAHMHIGKLNVLRLGRDVGHERNKLLFLFNKIVAYLSALSIR